jgi:nitrogen-specific signal transduction histidine kinase
LEKILDRIRNYLKPVEPCQQECSVNMIIKECVDLLTPEIDGRGIQYRLNLDSAIPVVYADPDVLTQVFINMIRNAQEAVDQGGVLSIKTYESDQNIHIDFRNSVCAQKIKDPETLFLSLDEGGQSIGLPLSYRLLKNMGGVISYAQEKDHLIFTVSVPRTTDANSRMEITAELSESSQGPMC